MRKSVVRNDPMDLGDQARAARPVRIVIYVE
jgi:hypothetical protein